MFHGATPLGAAGNGAALQPQPTPGAQQGAPSAAGTGQAAAMAMPQQLPQPAPVLQAEHAAVPPAAPNNLRTSADLWHGDPNEVISHPANGAVCIALGRVVQAFAHLSVSAGPSAADLSDAGSTYSAPPL